MSRIYTIRGKSKFAGEYIIYEGETEFNKLMPGVPVKVWGKDWNIESGDYVRADDGYIIKCLKRSEIKTANTGICILFKFPQGTFYLRRYTSGKERVARFCAQFTVNHRSNISGNKSTGLERTEKDNGTYNKTRFIGLLLSGVPITVAYKQTWGFYPISPTALKKKVIEVMSDPEVQLAMREQYLPFIEKFKSDPDFNDEAMVTYVKDFMRHVRKGSMVHLQSIIPLLRLMGKLPGEEKNAKLTKANQVGFEEIPPPRIEE